MTKHLEKQRKQDLGIFYTPPEVVNFIFDILNIWKEKEDKETNRWTSRKHYPSVIDPAVGDGIFLKAAIQSGFTKPDWIFGLDIDSEVVKKWKEINLLKEFGGNEEDLEAHFFHQNGLDRIRWEQHVKKYKYKLKQKDIGDQQFNVAVGNPPYGGLGIYEEMRMLSESVLSARKVQRIYTQKLDTLFGEQEEKILRTTTTEHVNLTLSQLKIFELKELSKNLLNLDIWKDKKYLPQRINHQLNINGVEINLKDILTLKEIEKLKGFPIEILFVERFIQLVKPGGWVAIIIPDGILSNSNAHYVRDFISSKSKVEAVVSLPRDTFKQAGTSAKTSILFLRKLRENEKPLLEHRVFLATADKVSKDNFQKIVEHYKQFYNLKDIMQNSKLVQITKDASGREIAMVRADLTVKNLMEEKPSSRWDPEYWHPQFDNLFGDIKIELELLGHFILAGTEGITYGSTKPREWSDVGKGVKYIKSVNVLNTGLDIFNIFWTPEGGRLDGLQYRVKVGDLVMNKSGTGTFGRLFVVGQDFGKIVVSQDTMRIRVNSLSPYFVAIYSQTKYGILQVQRLTAGVSGQVHIDFEDIKSIKIPRLSEKVQKNIEEAYKKMAAYHDKAMGAKKKDDEAGYKKNIETAEKMLKDIIAKTEAVIRGERKDVI